MRAALHNAALAGDGDMIGIAHGAQPVHDDHGCAVLPCRYLVKSLVHDALALAVKCTRRLIEQHD